MRSAPPVRSLFGDLPVSLTEEVFETWLETPGLRVERILSRGQATPEGTWYDQEWDEWVLLLRGAARLAIEGEATERELAAGDSLLLPAHCRHRVTWTPSDRVTVWLALHVASGEARPVAPPVSAGRLPGGPPGR